VNVPALARRALAEFTGTGLLVAVGSARGSWLRASRRETPGLVLVVFALARSARAGLAPAAVAGWVGAAYWATSSTSFANPAVTIGRAFTDTFTGIAPGSVPGFVAAQAAGAVLGAALVLVLYPAARPGPGSRPAPADRETAAGMAVPPAGN
jgi:glycerol uptake facilitator-like aquaporin